MLTVAAVNGLSRERFVAALGPVFEHAPWVAEGAWASRPHGNVAALHAAMVAVLRAAGPDARLAFLRGHPELAGGSSRAGAMTAESESEQGGAGLDGLDAVRSARLDALNAAYRARFSFPFILAVRGRDAAAILRAFEERLPRGVAEEMRTALGEVEAISRMRLERLVRD